MGIYAPVTIKATPEQVEQRWTSLTGWQKQQVADARAMGKTLYITVIDIDNLPEKILYDVSVCHD